MGIHQTKNPRVGKCKISAKVAVACETSTRRETKARYEFPCLKAGKDVKSVLVVNGYSPTQIC
ncbi:MAG: hypothetical protein MGU50_11320 [Trichodesmium sp. MAG_R02]|nr:hypothetical protein [Trichodesmium sp. MAG_R02]